MKNTALRILLLWLVLSAFGASAQTPVVKPVNLFFEKVYLHTDRNAYSAGDTLWFKAYLVNAQNNVPAATSSTLYTELISGDKQIINSRIIKLNDGGGHGDYQLPDTLVTGKYYLRAYTNWMRNFGDDFIFIKEISVIGANKQQAQVVTKPKVSDKKENKTTNKPLVVKSNPVVRFYPEGGALVNGIASMIAVKAEGNHGRDNAVKGVIISSEGDTAARFTCDSSGMGVFAFLPLKSLRYHAVVGTIPHTFPEAVASGLTLRVTQADTLISAIVQSNDSVPANCSMVIRHGGLTIIKHQLKVEKQATVNFSTRGLPEGISAITLYDGQGKPQCERLVYIHQKETSPITVNPEKQQYDPGEAVVVNVKAPANSSLSMAVVDAAVMPKEFNSIVPYLLLQSEIKGPIEHIARYFDTTNVNRFKQLDLLLMTQGWREFIWRRLADTTVHISYAPESGIAVKGMIEDEITKKRLPHLNITLYASGAKGNKLFSDTTSPSGGFAFSNLQLTGQQSVSLTSMNNQGKKKGTFMMDTLSSVPFYLAQVPSIDDNANADSLITDAITQRERTAGEIGLKKVVRLNAVKVTGKRKVLMLRNGLTYTPWGPKPQSFTITPQDEKFKTLEWYILQNVRGARTKADGAGIYFGKLGRPVILANDEELNMLDTIQANVYMDLYFNMSITKFKSIKVEYVIGALNDEKVLLFLSLKENALIDNPGSLNFKVNGYYEARTFYQPVHQNELSPAELNPTLYWQPYVKTDAHGAAVIKFRGGHIPSKYSVITQGITNTGKPLSAITTFEVR